MAKGDTFADLAEREPSQAALVQACLRTTATFFSEVEAWRREFKAGKNRKLIRAIDELSRTRKTLGRILGRVSPELVSWQRRLWADIDEIDMGSEEARAACRSIREAGPRLKVQARLGELVDDLASEIYQAELGNPLIPVRGLVGEFLEVHGGGLIDAITKIRIEPSKVIFNLWHRVLRKGGRYRDNKLVWALMQGFEETTRGTPAEIVFRGVGETEEFESLRKQALFGLSRISKDLVEFLFRASRKMAVEKVATFKRKDGIKGDKMALQRKRG